MSSVDNLARLLQSNQGGLGRCGHWLIGLLHCSRNSTRYSLQLFGRVLLRWLFITRLRAINLNYCIVLAAIVVRVLLLLFRFLFVDGSWLSNVRLLANNLKIQLFVKVCTQYPVSKPFSVTVFSRIRVFAFSTFGMRLPQEFAGSFSFEIRPQNA